MARYKHYDYAQMKLVPVSFAEQILPGSFEHALNQLIDEHFDLSVFEAQYRNDETGAPAYDPARPSGSDSRGSYNVYEFKNRDWRKLSNNGAAGPGGMMTAMTKPAPPPTTRPSCSRSSCSPTPRG